MCFILHLDEFPTLTPTTPPTSPVLGASKHSSHVPSENSLALCIRHYISDTLTSHLLGHPSHALSCIILSITHHLGINFENRPMTLDEICKTVNKCIALVHCVLLKLRHCPSPSDVFYELTVCGPVEKKRNRRRKILYPQAMFSLGLVPYRHFYTLKCRCSMMKNGVFDYSW